MRGTENSTVTFSKIPCFQHFTTRDQYVKAGIRFCDPMTAKELESDEDKLEALTSPDNYVEEKFDGTRALLHFFSKGGKGYTRCFSRRVSVETDWFCENTDSLPHLRDMNVPELDGTIIDGEMFIDGQPFKAVSSTLNCNYDKAIERQEELGYITLHAFDILYYKGMCIEKMPLKRRKEFLNRVVTSLQGKGYKHVVEVPYYACDQHIIVKPSKELSLKKVPDTYPELQRCLERHPKTSDGYTLTPTAYYEYIVYTGGEGVIVKSITGKYHYERGWEYSKIKKFLTRECVLMRFTEPTKEYKGKFPSPDIWPFWESPEGTVFNLNVFEQRKHFEHAGAEKKCFPVSKYYAEKWVGNILFGVVMTDSEKDEYLKAYPKTKVCTKQGRFNSYNVVCVGECSGFDEEMRREFTKNRYMYESLEVIVEIKANEIFRDTGKLRHPRFLRLRPDKSYVSCTWKNHIL